jgi:hypothetical protein
MVNNNYIFRVHGLSLSLYLLIVSDNVAAGKTRKDLSLLFLHRQWASRTVLG